MLKSLSLLCLRSEVHVLVRKGYETPDVRELAAEAALCFRATDAPSLLDAVADCCDGSCQSSDVLAVVTPECALLPPGCLEPLAEAHNKGGNSCTVFSGLPITPLLFDRRVLELARAGETEAAVDLPGFFRAIVASVPEGTFHQIPGPAVLGLNPELLPFSVDLSNDNAVLRLSRLTRDFQDAASNMLLYAWKQETLAEIRTRSPLQCQRRRTAGKIRVMFVSEPCAYSGAEESLCRMIRSLPPSRFDLSALIGSDGHFSDHLKDAGVRVTIAGGEFSAPRPSNFIRIAGILSAGRPDIVHINSPSGMPVISAAKVMGIPVVHHVRVPRCEGIAAGLSYVDALIAVSDYVRRQLLRLDVPPERIEVVHDGIDLDGWMPPSNSDRSRAKVQFGIDPGKVVVLNVARFEPRKRHDLLVRALARVRCRNKFHLILVGESFDSPMTEHRLDQMLRQTGLWEITSKLPFQADIRMVERASDLAVLVSQAEPLGTAILESMAMAIPVIVGADGGLAEIISAPEHGGILVPAGDPDSLAQHLECLIENRETRALLGARARLRCAQICDIRLCADKIAAIYEQIIGRFAVCAAGAHQETL